MFPPRCAVCDGLLEPGEDGVHAACEAELFWVENPVCMHCGRPLMSDRAEYCFDCAKRMHRAEGPQRDGRPFSCLAQGKAVFLYEGAIKRTMYRFKYGNRREYADYLADCACERWGTWIGGRGVEAVVPVPMYRPKERRRGYNQAALFGRAVAKRMGLAFLPDAVKRVRNTRPQKEVKGADRENNLKNAFQTADFIVQYNCILLVDDIYTTGSTMEAVAEELCRAGVGKIYFLAVSIGKGF